MVTLENDLALAPRIVRAQDGDWTGFGPESVRWILTSAQTGGAFSMMEARIDAPHHGPPYHVHTLDDETFRVMEGSVVLVVDGVRHELNEGDVAFAPRNVPHRFETGPNGARMLILSSGDNFERFLPRFHAAMSVGEMEMLPIIAGEHGISFLLE